MTLRFAAREPVGKNATFARGKGNRLYRTKEAVEFEARIAWAALAAAKHSDWPRDVYVPASVRVTVALFNGRWDAGACDTIVCDALEGILYANDRIVSHGPAELPATDFGERRAEITVELLAVRSQAEVDRLRTAAEKRAAARRKSARKRRTA